MLDPYLGQIAVVAFNYAPKGWTFCNGQILAIAQNQALFSLLGTTYGGNGVQTFALPDLRGRVALSSGQGFGLSDYALGQVGGVETVSLLQTQIPQHIHQALGTTAVGTIAAAKSNKLADQGVGTVTAYKQPPQNSPVLMGAGTLGDAGGSQPHSNQQPYLVMNFIIALQGIFPSRN
jgi:microcystin-dependent protein